MCDYSSLSDALVLFCDILFFEENTYFHLLEINKCEIMIDLSLILISRVSIVVSMRIKVLDRCHELIATIHLRLDYREIDEA